MHVYVVLDLDQHEQVTGLFSDAYQAIGAALSRNPDPVVHPLTGELHEAGYLFAATPRFSPTPQRPTLLVKRLEVQ